MDLNLARYTEQVKEMLREAENEAAKGDHRRAVYQLTEAVERLLSMVNHLASK